MVLSPIRPDAATQPAPQVAVPIGSGIVLFRIARRFARKWEYQ
jgi:hypothetical protein